MNDEEVRIITRDFNPERDQAFVYSTWRNQSWYSAINPPDLTPGQYFREKSKQIKKYLAESKVKIACTEDQPDIIIGYAVYNIEETHLDWVYVKFDFRNSRIATLLVPKTIQTVTEELTKIGKAIVDKKNLTTKEN